MFPVHGVNNKSALPSRQEEANRFPPGMFPLNSPVYIKIWINCQHLKIRRFHINPDFWFLKVTSSGNRSILQGNERPLESVLQSPIPTAPPAYTSPHAHRPQVSEFAEPCVMLVVTQLSLGRGKGWLKPRFPYSQRGQNPWGPRIRKQGPSWISLFRIQ